MISAQFLWAVCFLFVVFGGVFGEDDVGGVAIVPDEYVKDGEPTNALESDVDINIPEFIPSKQWKTIKQGQRVPPGLHYRLNLETGLKEAKLLDEIDPKDEEKPKLRLSEMEKALKDLNDRKSDDIVEPTLSPEQEARAREIRSQFRPYEALKKEFDEMNLAVMTDQEIIRELLSEYKRDNATDSRRLMILEDLEYYVHQIDNALVFIDYGGLEPMKEALNHSQPEFRQLSAFLLGSAAQSNPKAQVQMVEVGILHDLLRHLPFESSPSASKKFIYALSAILRNFPFAQHKFLELGGPDTLMQAFNSVGVNERQKVKMTTLLFDLIMEKQLSEERELMHAAQIKADEWERIKQYRTINVMNKMIESGWCEVIPRLLSLSDWDSQEKVLNTMSLMMSQCKADFMVVKDRLISLKGEYQNELKADSDNDYLEGLLKMVESIISQLFASVKGTEL